jgi:hypothetical protein
LPFISFMQIGKKRFKGQLLFPLYLKVCEVRVGVRLAAVDQFILISGLPLGPMTRRYLSLLFSFDNCFVVLPVRRSF